MDPFDTYPFDFNVEFTIKAIQGVLDWATGNTPVTVTPDAKDRIDAIDQKHHIPVTVATDTITDAEQGSDTSYVCAPLPEEKQVGELTRLQRELSKMPAAVLQRVGIKNIILCGSLESRLDISPFPDFTSTLDGLSNHASHTIYLSVARVFHHELFHLMWGQNGACRNSILSACQDTDEEWTALEPDKKFFDPNEERPNYAMDLFNLDTADGQKRYDDIMQQPETRAKMNKVKGWLKYVDPRLDERFWSDLRSGKVDEEYWSRRK